MPSFREIAAQLSDASRIREAAAGISDLDTLDSEQAIARINQTILDAMPAATKRTAAAAALSEAVAVANQLHHYHFTNATGTVHSGNLAGARGVDASDARQALLDAAHAAGENLAILPGQLSATSKRSSGGWTKPKKAMRPAQLALEKIDSVIASKAKAKVA